MLVPLFFLVGYSFLGAVPGKGQRRVATFLSLALGRLASRVADSSFPLCPVCPKWAFGPGCSEECRCVQQNTQDCDKRDGSCRCKPGYRGERCETSECQEVSTEHPPFSPRALLPSNSFSWRKAQLAFHPLKTVLPVNVAGGSHPAAAPGRRLGRVLVGAQRCELGCPLCQVS